MSDTRRPRMDQDGNVPDPHVSRFGTDELPPAWREAKVPHEWVPDENRDGTPGEGLACCWCGVTEAEMEAANGRLDLCGFLPSERWDGSRD